jgi:hypothetical protein
VARVTVVSVAAATLSALLLRSRGAPLQHVWFATTLVILLLGVNAERRRFHDWYPALVALLAGAAVVNRATVAFVGDGSVPVRALEALVTLGLILACMAALWHQSRILGLRGATHTAATGAMLLACLGIVIERIPGSRLNQWVERRNKGPVPHRTLGHWYEPHSRVRTFHTTNPRGYLDRPQPMRRQWRLALNDARDQALLKYPADGRPMLRVEIDRAGSGLEWGVQLNEGQLTVRAETKYRLRFAARADRPRHIRFAIAESHPPWEGLGYSRQMKLETEWTWRTDTLTLLRGDANARVHFDLGGDSSAVEVAEVELTDLTNGQRVEPERLAFSLTYQFNDLGCRAADRSKASVPGTRRILVLGDSYALGVGVRDTDTFASRLEAILNDSLHRKRPSTTAFEVMNCSVPGWGTRQQRLFYNMIKDRYAAELVLLTTTWNDERLVLDESAPTRSEERAIDRDAALTVVGTEVLRLRDAVRHQSARLAVIVFRNSSGEVWSSLLQGVAAALDSTEVPVLDLWPLLQRAGQPEHLVLDPSGDWHPNEIAHRVAGAAIAHFVLTNGLVR